MYTQQQAREAAAAEQARRDTYNTKANAQDQLVADLNKKQAAASQPIIDQNAKLIAAANGNYRDPSVKDANHISKLISYDEWAKQNLTPDNAVQFARTGSGTGGTQVVANGGYDTSAGNFTAGHVMPGSQLNQTGQSYTPSDASQLQGQDQSYNTDTGVTTAATQQFGNRTSAAGVAANNSGLSPTAYLAQLKKTADTYSSPTYKFDPIADAGKTTEEKNAIQTNYLAAKKQADDALKMQEDSINNFQQKTQGSGVTAPDTPKTSPVDSHLDSLGIDPSIKQGIQSFIDQSNQRVKDIESQQAQGKIDQQSAQDAINQVYKDTETAALDQKQKQLDYNSKLDSLENQSVENSKLDADAKIRQEQSQADLETDIAYHKQDQLNIETEMQNRNLAAKLGINFDTGGLKWMQDQKQKGVDALTFISRQAAVNDAGFADKMAAASRDYTQNSRTAFLDATQRYNDAIKTYNDTLIAAKKDKSTQGNSTRQFYSTQAEKLSTDIYNIDKDLGNTYKDLNGQLSTKLTAQMRIDAANKLANIKMTTADQKFDVKEYDSLSKMRDDASTKMAEAYRKETGFVDYDLFKGITNKLSGLITTAQNNPTAVTATLFSDIFAQLGNMKPTARMPTAMLDLLHTNIGTLDTIKGKIDKLQGKGSIPVSIINDMVDAINNMAPAIQSAAIADQQQYLLHIAQYNTGLKTGHADAPEILKLDPSTIFPADLYSPAPSPGSDDPTDIFKGNSTYSPQGSFSPSAMRTDRNNNPVAAAMKGDSPNQFTKALDNAGIAWEKGDRFPADSKTGKQSDQYSIRIKGDPIEGARAILADSNAIQGWYINHTGKSILPKYAIKTNEDFKKLSTEDQNAVIKGIYQSEGGDGSLFANNQPNQDNLLAAAQMMQNDLLYSPS